jgi:Carbohydrate-selective porin, OprB family
MRHFTGRVGAILISALGAASVPAAAATDCADCKVADAFATVLHADDRPRSGMRAGAGYWLLSVTFDDLETCWLDPSSRTLTGATDDDVETFRRSLAIEEAGNPIGEYVGAGIVYESAAVEGWRGQVGVAVGFAELAAPFERALNRSGVDVADRAAIYELSYRVELSEGFALQSDVQFARNPGMDAAVDSSWTVGLRFEIGAR